MTPQEREKLHQVGVAVTDITLELMDLKKEVKHISDAVFLGRAIVNEEPNPELLQALEVIRAKLLNGTIEERLLIKNLIKKV